MTAASALTNSRDGLKKWRRPWPVANYGHPPAKVAGAPMESCRFVSMDATAKPSFSASQPLIHAFPRAGAGHVALVPPRPLPCHRPGPAPASLSPSLSLDLSLPLLSLAVSLHPPHSLSFSRSLALSLSLSLSLPIALYRSVSRSASAAELSAGRELCRCSASVALPL